MAQKTLDTPENWGAAAADYAPVASIMMQPFAEAIADRLDVRPEHGVLEVAAGTGALTMTLA